MYMYIGDLSSVISPDMISPTLVNDDNDGDQFHHT